MRLGVPRNKRYPLVFTAVAALGALALLQHWIADRRPQNSELTANQEFVVTSSADNGPGSLREAIFAADSAKGRARIVIAVEAIALRTSLPPLVNPAGVVIEAGTAGAEIDAGAMGSGAVLDIDAPNSVVRGLRFVNAPAAAVLVRADGFWLTDGAIRGADEGLYVASGIQNLLVERMRFESNRIGIRLESAVAGIVVRNNRFSRHRDAAVWAVRGTPSYDAGSRGFALHSNNFDEDRMSLVLGNTPAQVEYNEFVKNGEVAVYLIGAGAVVRGNRIRNGGGIGVFVDATQGTLIDSNEIDHNHALAVLVRHSRDALLQGNRIYDNGYGIVFVLNEHGAPNVAAENTLFTQRFDGIVVIGDSPVLRRNLAMKNRSAGIRVLDFFPLAGARIRARPFLDRNTLEGNTPNEPTRGEYRVQVADRN